MIVLQLPLPNKELNPNVCRHFYQKAKVKAVARTIGYELSKDYFGEFSEDSRIKLNLVVYNKDKRLRDLDNVLASCKAVLDGVFSGLGIDDNQIDKIIISRGAVDKIDPRIDLTISEIKN